jgi:hypothetical protein
METQDGEFLNEKPFEHLGRVMKFKADHCDFRNGVEIHSLMSNATPLDIMNDVAEMIGYHALNIHPYLNGFMGYDLCNFKAANESR